MQDRIEAIKAAAALAKAEQDLRNEEWVDSEMENIVRALEANPLLVYTTAPISDSKKLAALEARAKQLGLQARSVQSSSGTAIPWPTEFLRVCVG